MNVIYINIYPNKRLCLVVHKTALDKYLFEIFSIKSHIIYYYIIDKYGIY